MIEYDTVFRARRLVAAAGEWSGLVGVMDGRIAAIAPPEADLEGRRVVELGDEAFVVDPKRLHQKHPITPYDGRALLGVVHRTWLRGEELAGDQPRGRLLTRGGA